MNSVESIICCIKCSDQHVEFDKTEFEYGKVFPEINRFPKLGLFLIFMHKLFIKYIHKNLK